MDVVTETGLSHAERTEAAECLLLVEARTAASAGKPTPGPSDGGERALRDLFDRVILRTPGPSDGGERALRRQAGRLFNRGMSWMS
jgi:hypothetical protein